MTLRGAKKEKKKCIFCGLPGKITKEHIWPKWIRPFIKFDNTSYIAASAHVHPSKHEIISTRRWDGDPRSRGVPVVCRDCNSGWMSALQSEAKAFLLPLIQGERYSISIREQEVLAAWVTMAVMTGEFFFPDAVAVSSVERLALSKSLAALKDWKIWAATYVRGDWEAHFAHSTRPLLFPGDSEPSSSELPRRNTQTTSFIVGQAYFHAFSCSYLPQVDRVSMESRDGKLVQIWPPLNVLQWPMPLISDLEADRIAGAIFERIDQDFRRSLK